MVESYHIYEDVDKTRITAIVRGLRDNGFEVEGSNPWTVDTKKHGVVLEGEWDATSSTLTITIKAKGFLISDTLVWDVVDPLIEMLQEEPCTDSP